MQHSDPNRESRAPVVPTEYPTPTVQPCATLKVRVAAAHCWFDFGFQVIPIVRGEKRPAAQWDPWLEALSHPAIEDYWRKNPGDDLGFIVGDDLIVFDADTSAAVAALEAIEEQHGATALLVVQTKRGVHHYFRRAPGTVAKSDSHSTTDHPERIDVKTGRALVTLPPSTDKRVLCNLARHAEQLTEATQEFIDAVFLHNGREVPLSAASAPKRGRPMTLSRDRIGQLRAALEHIDPDAGYDEWVRVLMAVHHETGGSDTGLDIADAWSAQGQKYCGIAELRKKWRSFDNYAGSPVTIATLRKMVLDAGIDWEAVCIAAEPGFEVCETEIIESPLDRCPEVADRENPLRKYSLTGKAAELELVAADEKPLLGELALLGQWTVLYGAPNTGKTLLTLALLIDAISLGRVNPATVYYVNVDDNLNGLTRKLRIAEEYRFHMLAEGHADFHAADMTGILRDLIEDGKAKGVVLILDTLKKFANLMDKAKIAAFNKVIRQFVMQGGTVIALAHTNKNRDAQGKPVYGGTSDVVDDADCAYLIDTLDASDAAQKVVNFECIKSRGNNAPKAFYRYSQEAKLSYEELLSSVEPVDATQLQVMQQETTLASDATLVRMVIECILEGINTKMNLRDAVSKRAAVSKRVALQVIERYTGDDPKMHKWNFSVKDRGAKVYSIIPSTEQT